MPNLDTQKTPAPKDWHRAYIKAALEKRGLSLTHIARTNGYARGSGSTALLIQWPKMERLIAAAIGLKPSQIWPSRYNADGTPKERAPLAQLQRALKHTTARTVRKVHARRPA